MAGETVDLMCSAANQRPDPIQCKTVKTTGLQGEQHQQDVAMQLLACSSGAEWISAAGTISFGVEIRLNPVE